MTLSKFYTRGPFPCAIEYSDVPGQKRGRVETGTEVTVLEYKVHVRQGYSYVAARVDSNFGDGYGWINICCEGIRFVVPISDTRPRNPPSWDRSSPY